ncbi:hypothetical protein U1Q18_044588 [Sarracenia purpurea var. burkii]
MGKENQKTKQNTKPKPKEKKKTEGEKGRWTSKDPEAATAPDREERGRGEVREERDKPRNTNKPSTKATKDNKRPDQSHPRTETRGKNQKRRKRKKTNKSTAAGGRNKEKRHQIRSSRQAPIPSKSPNSTTSLLKQLP